MSATKGKTKGSKSRGRPRGESTTSPRRLEAKERHHRALLLRMSGVSYPAIAAQLGYADASGAYNAVMAELDAMLREPAESVREMELARLDRLLRATMPLAEQGILGAVDRVIKISERRARLMGLDAPTIIEWRKMAAEAGLDPVQEFERMVNYFTERLAGGDGSGGAS